MSLFRPPLTPNPRDNERQFMQRAEDRVDAMTSKGVVTQSEIDELRVRFGIVFRDLRPARRNGGEACYRANQIVSALATGDLIQTRPFIPEMHSVG